LPSLLVSTPKRPTWPFHGLKGSSRALASPSSMPRHQCGTLTHPSRSMRVPAEGPKARVPWADRLARSGTARPRPTPQLFKKECCYRPFVFKTADTILVTRPAESPNSVKCLIGKSGNHYAAPVTLRAAVFGSPKKIGSTCSTISALTSRKLRLFSIGIRARLAPVSFAT